VSTNLDGGTLVLYAVAAAVIGGTSLFGLTAIVLIAAVTIDALARRANSATAR
jgi:ABC-type xylose transport system permease subunit